MCPGFQSDSGATDSALTALLPQCESHYRPLTFMTLMERCRANCVSHPHVSHCSMKYSYTSLHLLFFYSFGLVLKNGLGISGDVLPVLASNKYRNILKPF